MRVPLIAPVLIFGLMASPALAQEAEEPAVAAVADELGDPARQEQVAGMAGAAMEAMLDMPVGPMLRAVAQAAGEDPEEIDPDTTMADMAGDDARDLPGEVADRVPQMMGTMAHMAGAFEEMLPALREMARHMEESMREATPYDE